jgi:hypothetical protein
VHRTMGLTGSDTHRSGTALAWCTPIHACTPIHRTPRGPGRRGLSGVSGCPMSIDIRPRTSGRSQPPCPHGSERERYRHPGHPGRAPGRRGLWPVRCPCGVWGPTPDAQLCICGTTGHPRGVFHRCSTDPGEEILGRRSIVPDYRDLPDVLKGSMDRGIDSPLWPCYTVRAIKGRRPINECNVTRTRA